MSLDLKDELLSEEEVAEIIRYSPGTLRKNRCNGKNHPPFVKVGRKVFYPRKEVMNWLKSHELHKAVS
jgi:predicted DNA-binding transcriptional regulator AlpA